MKGEFNMLVIIAFLSDVVFAIELLFKDIFNIED